MHFMVDFAVDLCTCCLQLVTFDAQMREKNANDGFLEMPRLLPACDCWIGTLTANASIIQALCT